MGSEPLRSKLYTYQAERERVSKSNARQQVGLSTSSTVGKTHEVLTILRHHGETRIRRASK